MTYNVFGGTLNLALSICLLSPFLHSWLYAFSSQHCSLSIQNRHKSTARGCVVEIPCYYCYTNWLL